MTRGNWKDWLREDDAHLMPYLEADFPKAAKEAIAQAVGRTPDATKQRLVQLRRRFRKGLPLENQPRERKPDTRGEQYKRHTAPAQIIKRKCVLCRVEFSQDRARTNYFRCDLHRHSDDWMAPASVGGRVRHVR